MSPEKFRQAAGALLARCTPKAPFLLMLDFDGTLARIRRRPEQARLAANWRRTLQALLHRKGLRLAIISGRGLPDLRQRLALDGAFYVGNHGLAWSQASLGPSPAQRLAWKHRTRRAWLALAPLLERYPGALAEDKGLDLSVHLRGVAPAKRAGLLKDLDALARRLGLRVRRGHKVVELRQRSGWDKGRAVRVLRATQPKGTPCFFAGDDVTDEAAFKALRGPASLTMKIGAGPTAARVQGRRQSLLAFLKSLNTALGRREKR